MRQIPEIDDDVKTVPRIKKAPLPMAPSRLAFRQEVELDLRSEPLRRWFEVTREGEHALQRFDDPVALRRFLHSDETDRRKPQIWQALVRSVHRNLQPHAMLFILGLLEPKLGKLVDDRRKADLEPEDLWQETVTCALHALANPGIAERHEVLAGVVLDTYKRLCTWLGAEFTQLNEEAPLLNLSYETTFEPPDFSDEETLLVEWCQRAGVNRDDAALILAIRLREWSIKDFAPAHSRLYYRLWKRWARAEARLKAWIFLSQQAKHRYLGTLLSTKRQNDGFLKGDARTVAVDPDRDSILTDGTTDRTKPRARPRRAASESVAANAGATTLSRSAPHNEEGS